MSNMLISFKFSFMDHSSSSLGRRIGPVFNRWLPDGLTDAIDIECDNDTKMYLWFERKGSIKNDNVIIPSINGIDNLPSELIERQPSLDAGHLFGKVELSNLSEDEMEAVQNNRSEDSAYVKLGKRLVNKVVYPYVDNLQNVLRVAYGQYWISPLPKWDSRDSSLGYYCKSLIMKWSVDGGETWNDFRPNQSVVNIKADIVISTRNDYIKKEDWPKIISLVKGNYTPSLGASMLSQAHQKKDQGELKYALIEAVTALEIALEERIVENIKGEKKLVDDIHNFWKLPMPAKLTIVASLLGNVSTEELEDSIRAIYLRNEVAHEAKPISKDSIKIIETLMDTVSKILVEPSVKFPEKHIDKDPSNMIYFD
ncbi:hypothetical protein [Priestia megaterium]|uniref:hypothetical protein n=1 Tax=Priestia megaterium TaxID=1404 RepID=UPI003D07E53C